MTTHLRLIVISAKNLELEGTPKLTLERRSKDVRSTSTTALCELKGQAQWKAYPSRDVTADEAQ